MRTESAHGVFSSCVSLPVNVDQTQSVFLDVSVKEGKSGRGYKPSIAHVHDMVVPDLVVQSTRCRYSSRHGGVRRGGNEDDWICSPQSYYRQRRSMAEASERSAARGPSSGESDLGIAGARLDRRACELMDWTHNVALTARLEPSFGGLGLSPNVRRTAPERGRRVHVSSQRYPYLCYHPRMRSWVAESAE